MSAADSDEDTLSEGPFSPGTCVDSYVIERRIGEGGMGVVYAGRHEALDKPVVVKALSPLLATHEESVARFLREGRAASRIRHPHVVDVTDVGTHEGVPYMVMELLEGEDLASRLKQRLRFSETEAVRIMLPVCDAVATAHELGVIHRDLKPSNIFLARGPGGRDVPMVLDFGLAKIFENKRRNDDVSLTRTAAFLGTPFYVAPEQAEDSSTVSIRSDQYALGAILYELVSGRRTVEGGNPFDVISAIIGGRVIPLTRALPEVSPELVRIVERAMERKPEDRYPTVRELGRALLERADRATRAVWEPAFVPDARMSLGPARASTGSRGTLLRVALAVLSVIVIVPLAWWWMSAHEPVREPPPRASEPAVPIPAPPAPVAQPAVAPAPEPAPAPADAPQTAEAEAPAATPEPSDRVRPRIRRVAVPPPQPTALVPSASPAPRAPVALPPQRGTNNAAIVR